MLLDENLLKAMLKKKCSEPITKAEQTFIFCSSQALTVFVHVEKI